MAARKLNRENEVAPELALVQGPVTMSCLGGEIVDEAMLLDGYDAHLQLLENRPKTTAGTYRSHVKGFLRYLAINYPSVTLSDVTKLQVRAWFLHEANRGISASHPLDSPVRCPQLLSVPHRRGPERGESRRLGDPPESQPAKGRVLQRPRGRRHHRVGRRTTRSPLAGRPGAPSDVEIHRLSASRRWSPCAPRRSTLTLGGSRSSERGASLGWSPYPTCWRTCSASTWTSCGPGSRRPRTCSPTPGATGASAAATGLGRCTISSWRPGPRRAWPVGTFPTGGVTAMPRASCAGARTSTSSSA